jgi:RhtB (resistance to homoserine/threonine) family protein
MHLIDAQVLTFAGLAALLTITPGSDTMLVIRSVLARGQRAGLLTTVGICCGLFIHASLSAAGLSLILVKSAAVFETVKLAGACYLVFLGIQSLRKLTRKPTERQVQIPYREKRASVRAPWKSFMEGMLNNLLNPKLAVFYLAFLPQFINPGDPVFCKSMLLAGIHFIMGIVWLSTVTLFLGKMRAFFASARVRKWLEATCGAVLIGMGITLAIENR